MPGQQGALVFIVDLLEQRMVFKGGFVEGNRAERPLDPSLASPIRSVRDVNV